MSADDATRRALHDGNPMSVASSRHPEKKACVPGTHAAS
jgi:hypothetical protein